MRYPNAQGCARLLDDLNGIGSGIGASSGYVSNIGSPGGDAEDACYSMTADGDDGDPPGKQEPMGPFSDDDGSAYGPPENTESGAETAAKVNTAAATVFTVGEGLSGITRIGSNFRFYTATARGGVFMGNQYVRTFSIAKGFRIAGYAAAGLGTAMDIRGMFIYRNNPNSPDAVSPGKAGFNLGMTIFGFSNPAGAVISTFYFIGDAVYPGGWMGDANNPGLLNDEAEMQHMLDIGINQAGPYRITIIPSLEPK